MATPESFDGGFNFCRIMFSESHDGDGGNWSVDYPRADINLSIRLSELTRTRISRDPSGEPNHVLLRLTDDLLFQCPFIMMTEVGSAYFSPEEAERLREYLLKGGFLWADDFWGTLGVGSVGARDRQGAAAIRVSDRRRPADASDLPSAVRRQTRHPDSVDRRRGAASAAARRSAAPTAPSRTRARSSTSTAT